MRCELLPVSAWKGVADTWEALNYRCHDDHPLLAQEWIGPLLSHFGTDATRIASWRANGGDQAMALVALAPWRPSTFSPSQMPILPAVGDAGTLFSGLSSLAWRGGAVRTDVMRVDPECTQLSSLRRRASSVLSPANRTMTVGLQDGWEPYWQQRSKRLRRDHGRFERRLGADYPGWRLEVVTDPNSLEEAVARYGRIEAAGWKAKMGSAIEPGNWQDGFYSDVMRAFASDGEGAAFFLTDGNEDLAARLTIWRGSSAIMLKTTYSEAHSQYRPGWIMLAESLKWLAESANIHRVEFYTNASQEQLRWASQTRQMYHASIYRSTILKYAVEGAGAARRRLTGLARPRRQS